MMFFFQLATFYLYAKVFHKVRLHIYMSILKPNNFLDLTDRSVCISFALRYESLHVNKKIYALLSNIYVTHL